MNICRIHCKQTKCFATLQNQLRCAVTLTHTQTDTHLFHTRTDTHTHTDKALCTALHSSRGQYRAPKPFRGAASRKMTPCCLRSPPPRLVTPVSQGPAEGPIPLGLPLTPHYLRGPNVNGGSSPRTMGATKRGKEMSQGSLTTKV